MVWLAGKPGEREVYSVVSGGVIDTSVETVAVETVVEMNYPTSYWDDPSSQDYKCY